MHPALHTPLLDVLGSRYPIVQTGMGWVAGPSLVSATSNAGAFGIIASATMTFDELVRAIAAVKKRTDAPFGVNFRADADDIKARLDLIIREGVPVASFAQAPKKDLIDHLHDHGVKVMPSIGAKRHAEKVMEWGVDAVLVQGGEGGGHTGAVPTSLLLPEVVDVVDGRVPVVAAGGYFDGRGLVAALAYGASGVAMGTRFLLTSDSSVPLEVKKAYLGTPVTGTLVTTKIDGAPHRVIRTELVDEMDSASPVTAVPKAVANAARFRKYTDLSWLQMAREGLDMKKRMDLSWAEVIMAGNTPMLTKATLVDGELDAGILPTGQVVGVIDDLPSAADLVERIIADAGATLDRLAGAPVVTRSGTDRI
jgi:NAD(P)H-dependent flavin oxidoreductase YrpB (nitropropane dioxygenase family)